MSGISLDTATALKIALLLGEILVKHGPKVAALWQRIFEEGRLPTPEDYAETERIIDTDGPGYFPKKGA